MPWRSDGSLEDAHATDRRNYDLTTVGKALDILEVIAADPPLGLAEITALTAMNKASVFRVLNTLESRDYLVKDEATRKWSLGHRLIALSSAVMSTLDIVKQARPVLEALHTEFGETVNLGILRGDRTLYVDMIESRRGLRTTAHVGSYDPLYSTALGKAILAALSWDDARKLLSATPREPRTPRTITSMRELAQQLADVRERGFSIDDEENELGARCIGVAVLDRNARPIAAISVSGPTTRMNDEQVASVGRRLHVAQAEVAWRMGYAAAPVDMPETRS